MQLNATRSASLILLASSVVRCACPSIPRALVVVCVVACSNAFFCIPALWHVWPVFSSFQSIFLLTCSFLGFWCFFIMFGQFLVSIHSALLCQNHGDSIYRVSLLPLFPISTDFLSVMGACFLPLCMGANGWVARIYHP